MKYGPEREFMAQAEALVQHLGMPPEAPLAMPKQTLEQPSQGPLRALARLIGRSGLPSGQARRSGS